MPPGSRWAISVSNFGAVSLAIVMTKAGNVYLRERFCRVFQPFPPSAQTRLIASTEGTYLASRGGKQARNKPVVAVGRKLAVLLHPIWTTQEPYMPFYEQAA
jgi:transposase